MPTLSLLVEPQTAVLAVAAKLPSWQLSFVSALLWRHNGSECVSNHQPHNCLLNRLFRRRSTKTWKLRVTGLCAGNSPATGEFPAQMASNAENVFIWWRHHGFIALGTINKTDTSVFLMYLKDTLLCISYICGDHSIVAWFVYCYLL